MITRGFRLVVSNRFRKNKIAARRFRFGGTRISMTAPADRPRARGSAGLH